MIRLFFIIGVPIARWLDSSFNDRTIILADQFEGKPLPAGKGPFRLVVPDEKKPARSCFQVKEFVIRFDAP